jgi:hypothetical protein
MQVERHRIVQADILGIDRIILDHAQGERHRPFILAPEKKAHLVGHQASKAADERLGELFEMQLRSVVDLEVQWIDLVDDG